MNVAIVLAVSDYQNVGCLPGCNLDAQLMKNLLHTTGRYSEILFIDKNTDSIQVKEELTEFITKNKGKVFDEIFFYYTGHGDFHSNEFYYILSDFNSNQYRQTSLSNLEVDNLLRQLNPALTVKIIDACHSGVTYIKDNEIFYKHLDESKNRFNNCYFMFSSMTDQASYQSKKISHFTKSFIDSVLHYSSTDLRYKHIIDYISDEFERNSLQKPFFVIQAGFTETFCSVNQKLRVLLSEQLDNSLGSKSETDGLKVITLSDLIKRDAERYCSEEEALEILDTIKNFIQNYSHSHDLVELYSVSSEFKSDYESISKSINSIGQWLKDNDNNYFAKANYRRELIASVNTSPILRGLYQSMADIRGESSYKTVVSGFELTVDVPFNLIKIDAYPKYPNIDWCDCKIAFAFSQVSIRFFYFYSNFKLKNWENYSHDFSSDWQTVEVEMKDIDKLKETISGILNKFDSFVLDPLRAKYVLTVKSRSDENS
ncbi:caspase family protein [Leptolyngbya boryana CZ1]|uniref:Caspase family protein n=1 Tax=Leptolyngbya boryana CZ1 TaxID=3060204 RepID=A0AA96XBI3_LEPBY|nr:caspase family protein [Leptolyngbya boryana]WNZ49130.1 caspase family protein [Leptolyngbya boryana CZ1]